MNWYCCCCCCCWCSGSCFSYISFWEFSATSCDALFDRYRHLQRPVVCSTAVLCNLFFSELIQTIHIQNNVRASNRVPVCACDWIELCINYILKTKKNYKSFKWLLHSSNLITVRHDGGGGVQSITGSFLLNTTQGATVCISHSQRERHIMYRRYTCGAFFLHEINIAGALWWIWLKLFDTVCFMLFYEW